MVQLWIKHGTRPRFSVDVQATDSVADVKKAVNASKGIPIPHQRLIYQGLVLRHSDEAKLAELNLPVGTHFILHVRVPQETPAPVVPKEAHSPPPAVPAPGLPAGSPINAGPGGAGGPLFAPADVQSILHNLSLQFGVPPAVAAASPVTPNTSSPQNQASPGAVHIPISTPPQARALPQSVFDIPVDANSLRALLEMGFPEVRARKALLMNRGGVQVAMEWLFEHANDPNIDSPTLTDEQRRQLSGPAPVRVNTNAAAASPQLQLPIGPPVHSIHPEAEQCIQRGQCTIVASGRTYVAQYYQHCYTCGFNTNEGCCTACIRNCHRGHNVSPPIYSPGFYCDCGAGARVPCKSLPPNFHLN